MERKKKKNPCSKSKDECMKKKHKKNKIVVDNKSDVYHISEDLIIEILLRLPPTSVLRFKYVCKTWYSLISNPDFLRTHASSLQSYKHTTIDDEELMVSSYLSKNDTLKYLKEKHPLLKQGVYPNELLGCHLINSCNGLLLLLCKQSNSSSYYVCNPMIKHYVKIPNISVNEKLKIWEPTSPCNILFDPSTSLSYKLIQCVKGIGENMFSFYVYSSDIGSWRLLRSFPSSEIGSWQHPAVFLNGIFYWKETYDSDGLVCFDLKEENVWFLPLPPKPMGNSTRMCYYFGEFDGRLRLIEKYFVSWAQELSYLSLPGSFDIMETEPQQLQQGGNLTWSVKYHVNINTGYDHLSGIIIQLYKTKKNEEALLLNIAGNIFSFNLENNTLKRLTIQNSSVFTCYSSYSSVFPYIKTTLLPLL